MSSVHHQIAFPLESCALKGSIDVNHISDRTVHRLHSILSQTWKLSEKELGKYGAVPALTAKSNKNKETESIAM
jgi:hypothetical protein